MRKNKLSVFALIFVFLLSSMACLVSATIYDSFSFSANISATTQDLSNNYSSFTVKVNPAITLTNVASTTTYQWLLCLYDSSNNGWILNLQRQGQNPCTIQVYSVSGGNLGGATLRATDVTVNLGLNLNSPNEFSVSSDESTVRFYNHGIQIYSVSASGFTLDHFYLVSGKSGGLTASGNVAVTVDSTIIKTVTFHISGDGTLNYADSSSHSFNYGETLTLTASPNTGSVFSYYTIVGGPDAGTNTNNPLSLTITESCSITAVFTAEGATPTPAPSPTATPPPGGYNFTATDTDETISLDNTYSAFTATIRPYIALSGVSVSSEYHFFVGLYDSSQDGYVIDFNRIGQGPNQIQLYSISGGSISGGTLLSSDVTVEMGLNLNTPNNVAVSYDGSVFSVYNNGKSMYSVVKSGFILSSVYGDSVVSNLDASGGLTINVQSSILPAITFKMVGLGTLNYAPDSVQTFANGTILTINASPNTLAGYYLQKITITDSEYSDNTYYQSPLSITVTESFTLTVYFSTLSASSTPEPGSFDLAQFQTDLTHVLELLIGAILVFLGMLILMKAPGAWIGGVILFLAGFFLCIIAETNVYGLMSFGLVSVISGVFLYTGGDKRSK